MATSSWFAAILSAVQRRRIEGCFHRAKRPQLSPPHLTTKIWSKIMARPHKYIKKIESLKEKLWPDTIEGELWHRKVNDGYFTLPRTMPLVMSIIDDLTKGTPASKVYLELWSRAYDEMYVSLSKASEMAYHSGFTGQRATRAWGQRIKMLHDLGFIGLKEGSAGPLSHALIYNPHVVIERLHKNKHAGLVEAKYMALIERGNEIGAEDVGHDPRDDIQELEDEIPF